MRSRYVQDALAFAVLLAACALLLWFRGDFATGVGLDAGSRIQLVAEMQARRALSNGDLPLWDADQFGGRPFLADSRSLTFYPPHVLFRAAPIEVFLPLNVLVHMWIAAIGAYLIGRSIRASLAPSIAAALAAVVTVGAPAFDIGRGPDFYAICWIPLIIACAFRSSNRSDWWPTAALIPVVAMAILAASERGAAYAVAAALGTYAFAMPWHRSSHVRWLLTAQGATTCALAAGLSAFHTLPAGLIRVSQERTGLVHDDAGAVRPDSERRPWRLQPRLTMALAPLKGHRTATSCEKIVDPSQLAAVGIPVVGGEGGLYSTYYARLLNIVRGDTSDARNVYRGVSGLGDAGVRADLLSLLGVEYLIACDRPDRRKWALVSELEGGAVYRNVDAVLRAFWTCAPRHVSEREAEYALRGPAGVTIHVRWAAAIDDDRRQHDEDLLALRPLRNLGDRTWQYQLNNPSSDAVAAIVGHPDVEDTQGIDRGTRTVISRTAPDFSRERQTEWLLDTACEQRPATVTEAHQADGSAILDVAAPRAGVVFLGDVFDAGRHVRVDGTPVEPMRVAFAFTAVPVAPGHHRIEVKYEPDGLRAGATLSATTLVLYTVGTWRSRRLAPRRSGTAAV